MTHDIPDTGEAMARKPYYTGAPRGFVSGAPVEMIKAEFGRVLQKRMADKGWNQSELARAAAKFMPNKKFERDNVSHYIRGFTLPGVVRLRALAKALGCETTDLLPVRSTEHIDAKSPPLDIRDLGDGTSWLRVNQAVPNKIAYRVMKLLVGEGDE